MVLKRTQIICLFFLHSLNKAFYDQECTLITPSPWCNQDYQRYQVKSAPRENGPYEVGPYQHEVGP